MYSILLDHILEKFQEYASTTRAVILSPTSKYANPLIARLLNHNQYTALYYSPSPDDTDFPTFIDNMIRAFIDQHDFFGRYTSLAHLEWHRGMPAFRVAALDGIIHDLNLLTDRKILLIIDDFDHVAHADDIQRFLEDLALRLPENCLLVVNGRAKLRFPWISLITQTHAIIFDDGHLIPLPPQSKSQDAFAELEICAIGPGFIYMNGEYIDKWEGHLPRLLLFFAVDCGIITRDDFHRAFWRDLDDVQATNVFHVTKRRLHRAFDMELLEHSGGNYSIRQGISIHYDVFEWTQALVAARDITNPDPTKDYEKVLSLYRGPFLKGHDDMWIVARRHDILNGYIEAVLFLAASQVKKYLTDKIKYSSALEKGYRLYLSALEESPNHPELVLAAAELLTKPEVSRRIEAHYLLQNYFSAKKSAKEPADERIVAFSKKLHNKKLAG